MDGLIEPSPIPAERDTSRRSIIIAIAVIVAIVAIAAIALRQRPKVQPAPPAYAVNLKFSDLKMSQAQNFVGATVTYVDGTLNNIGDKTVTHMIVQVTFSDSYNQIAQIESVPIRILQTAGPYDDTADVSQSPLGPGQSKCFRLTFEHVSEQWNQAYPQLKVTDVTVK
jgi:hypothetical protein